MCSSAQWSQKSLTNYKKASEFLHIFEGIRIESKCIVIQGLLNYFMAIAIAYTC